MIWFSSFPAIFGVLSTPAVDVEDGIPTRAIGIGGVSQCSMTANMPSTNIINNNAVSQVGNAIYSFGGKVITSPGNLGSRAVYRYDLTSNTWEDISNMIHERYNAVTMDIGDNQILITGKTKPITVIFFVFLFVEGSFAVKNEKK